MRRSIMVVGIIWATTMLMNVVNGRLVNVGGRNGWNPGVNYTDWSFNQSFFVGDWIGFRYDSGRYQYDVVEVNQTGYETCNTNFIVTNITRGAGRDVYELKEARPYYFICTKGFCWNGMKIAINVTIPSPPAPAPQGNHASAGIGIPLLLVLAFSIATTLFINNA